MAIQDFDQRFEPFGAEPDYRLYYNSRPHAKALITINEGIATGEGFVVVTGEPGSGRTTLLNFVLSRLEPGRFVAARLNARECESLPVLPLIARGFGMSVGGASEEALETKLQKFLADSRRRGRRGLLLIDEAQDLPPVAFEALLRLSSPRDEEGQVLQAVLFGQAELRDLLYGHDLSRYRLNVVASHHLQALDLEDTRRLIDHRLRQTGSSGDRVFADDAVEMIHLQTGGIPGRIVNLCRELMERAAAMGLPRVDGGVIQQLSLKRKKDWVRDEGASSEAQTGEETIAALHLTEPAPPETDTGVGREDALPAFLAQGLEGDGASANRTSRLPVTLVSAALTIGLSALILLAWQRQGDEPLETGITVPLSETEQAARLVEDQPVAAPTTEAEPAPAAESEAATTTETEPPEAPRDQLADVATEPLSAKDQAPDDQTSWPAESAVEPLAGADQDSAVFVVPPPPPPALDTAASEIGGAPDEPAELVVEPAVGDSVEPLEAGETLEAPSAVALATEPAEQQAPAAEERVEESDVAADIPEPPAPSDDETLAAITLVPTEAPEEAAESTPSGPIDLTPWKTGGGATPPETGGSSTAQLSSLGDKTVSHPAAAEAKSPIAEDERLAAATTELKEPSRTVAGMDLSVTELLLARRIEDREPVGREEPFVVGDEQVYAFARVSNPGPKSEVFFRWYLNDAFVGEAEMKVGTSPGWRTWSVIPLDPGSWYVEVTDPDGRILARRNFSVD